LTQQQFKLFAKAGLGLFTHFRNLLADFDQLVISACAAGQLANAAAILNEEIPFPLMLVGLLRRLLSAKAFDIQQRLFEVVHAFGERIHMLQTVPGKIWCKRGVLIGFVSRIAVSGPHFKFFSHNITTPKQDILSFVSCIPASSTENAGIVPDHRIMPPATRQ